MIDYFIFFDLFISIIISPLQIPPYCRHGCKCCNTFSGKHHPRSKLGLMALGYPMAYKMQCNPSSSFPAVNQELCFNQLPTWTTYPPSLVSHSLQVPGCIPHRQSNRLSLAEFGNLCIYLLHLVFSAGSPNHPMELSLSKFQYQLSLDMMDDTTQYPHLQLECFKL